MRLRGAWLSASLAVMAESADRPGWLGSVSNPYLEGVYAPVTTERTLGELTVRGEIPRDLVGVYMRNGPNQVHQPRGRHHWFDGDGMVHSVAFQNGQATYRNRWLRTEHFVSNLEAGKEQWPGYMEPPDPCAPAGAGSDGWLKDSANTDLLVHNGSVLALWYQAGIPLKLNPETGETIGPETFGGALARQVSAHAKTDPTSGALSYFDYNTQEPFLTYHELSAAGTMSFECAVDVPGPRLPHDMGITENYAILHDLPLFWDPELLVKGLHKVTFYPDLPSRFALVPRGGPAAAIRWFEAEPAYLYHVVNAWEEGDWVIMDGCRTTDPCPKSLPMSDSDPQADRVLSRMMAFLLLKARLYRWRFNLVTGETREEWLDDSNAEFPIINENVRGRPSNFSYHVSIPLDRNTMVFDGLIKYDNRNGSKTEYRLPKGWVASEAAFAPRARTVASDDNDEDDEDDGYLVTFATDLSRDRSEVHVLDAANIEAGPIAVVELPVRVPAGFHATWVDRSTLGWTGLKHFELGSVRRQSTASLR